MVVGGIVAVVAPLASSSAIRGDWRTRCAARASYRVPARGAGTSAFGCPLPAVAVVPRMPNSAARIAKEKTLVTSEVVAVAARVGPAMRPHQAAVL